MHDAIGEDLEPGDYVVVCLGDWVNNQHLGKVMGGGKRMVSVAVKIYDRPVETRLIQANCLVKVDRDAAIKHILTKSG